MFISLLDLLRQAGLRPTTGGGPVFTLQDRGDHLLLEADLAGFDPRSVQIQLTETSLTISASATRQEQTTGPGFVQSSSSASSFIRQIALPATIDPQRASLRRLDGGRLQVIMPKR